MSKHWLKWCPRCSKWRRMKRTSYIEIERPEHMKRSYLPDFMRKGTYQCLVCGSPNARKEKASVTTQTETRG